MGAWAGAVAVGGWRDGVFYERPQKTLDYDLAAQSPACMQQPSFADAAVAAVRRRRRRHRCAQSSMSALDVDVDSPWSTLLTTDGLSLIVDALEMEYYAAFAACCAELDRQSRQTE